MTNNNITIPDRTCSGITTSAYSIGYSQDGCAKLDIGTKEILTTHTQKITITRRTLKSPTIITTIGTWNVRTLRGAGKIHELTRELDRYRWDIIGLAETRWKNSGELITEEGHKIVYSNKQNTTNKE